MALPTIRNTGGSNSNAVTLGAVDSGDLILVYAGNQTGTNMAAARYPAGYSWLSWDNTSELSNSQTGLVYKRGTVADSGTTVVCTFASGTSSPVSIFITIQGATDPIFVTGKYGGATEGFTATLPHWMPPVKFPLDECLALAFTGGMQPATGTESLYIKTNCANWQAMVTNGSGWDPSDRWAEVSVATGNAGDVVPYTEYSTRSGTAGDGLNHESVFVYVSGAGDYASLQTPSLYNWTSVTQVNSGTTEAVTITYPNSVEVGDMVIAAVYRNDPGIYNSNITLNGSYDQFNMGSWYYNQMHAAYAQSANILWRIVASGEVEAPPVDFVTLINSGATETLAATMMTIKGVNPNFPPVWHGFQADLRRNNFHGANYTIPASLALGLIMSWSENIADSGNGPYWITPQNSSIATIEHSAWGGNFYISVLSLAPDTISTSAQFIVPTGGASTRDWINGIIAIAGGAAVAAVSSGGGGGGAASTAFTRLFPAPSGRLFPRAAIREFPSA